MKRHFTAVLLLSITCFCGAAHAQTPPTYDGKWWLSVSKQERLGFFEGYATCYTYDTDGKVRFTESGYAYEPRLTDYIQQNPDQEAKPIEELLLKMATPPYRQSVKRMPGVAEVQKGKYGYLDGDYWRQAPGERLGLIEGFLYCYSRHARASVGTFSEPASRYVDAISKWYGVKDDDPGEINPARMNVKIPVVLFKFRDNGKHK